MPVIPKAGKNLLYLSTTVRSCIGREKFLPAFGVTGTTWGCFCAASFVPSQPLNGAPPMHKKKGSLKIKKEQRYTFQAGLYFVYIIQFWRHKTSSKCGVIHVVNGIYPIEAEL
jgi:hypothetical protein